MDHVVTSTVTIATEVLENAQADVPTYIAARLRERLPQRVAELMAEAAAQEEEDIFMLYGDPSAPEPRGIIDAKAAT